MEMFYTPVIITVLLIPTVTLAYQCHEQICHQGVPCSSPTTCETTVGCSTRKTTDMEVYSCAATVDYCLNMAIDNGVLTSTECCTSDLCNDGTVQSLPQPQTENYCYAATCSSNSTCLDSLITHVQDNQVYAYCKATNLGCETTLIYRDGTYTETAGCATYNCMTAEAEGFTQLCCPDNLCNSATTQTIDPNKPIRWAAVYQSGLRDTTRRHDPLQSDGQQCTSLADAIQQGDTLLCEKAPGMSCIYHASVGPGSARILVHADCESAVLPCMPSPTMITYVDGQTVPTTTQTHCCDGDRCNAGQAITADPNKDQCYNMMCTNARDGSCISQAIADGKASFCDKGISGCPYTYVISSNGGSTITAKCNTDGTTCTPMAQYDANDRSMKTACCNESSCNSHGSTAVPDPTKSQCYEMECKGTDCLKKAIAADVYNLCDQTGFGCEVQEARITGIYSMGCAASTCTEGTQLNTETIMCCDGDLCQHSVIGAASRTFMNMSLGLAVMFLYCVM